MHPVIVGRESIAMDYLVKLVEPEHVYCCSCVYCGESSGYDGAKGHEEDCVWLAAKRFVEQIKAIDSLGGVPILALRRDDPDTEQGGGAAGQERAVDVAEERI